MLEKTEVIILSVPRFHELNVKDIWELVKEVDELLQYFPDYPDGQLPERDFLFTILSTVRPEGLKQIIK